jgi:hypothetical protein
VEYRSVGNRCAVNLDSLHLPISREKIITMLNLKGFILLNVDMIALARECLEKSRYRRGARLFEAPLIVDCSSLMKWLYAQRGIWLPRRSIQQREVGEAVGLNEIMAGDLVFVSGWIDYYYDNPANGVGHVGMATGENTVIHASNSETNIIESPLEKFIGGENRFRGARRYIPNGVEVLTLETPAGREVEIADDIRWIILQSLPR